LREGFLRAACGRRLVSGLLGCKIVLGTGHFELFQFDLHLVEKPRLALAVSKVMKPARSDARGA